MLAINYLRAVTILKKFYSIAIYLLLSCSYTQLHAQQLNYTHKYFGEQEGTSARQIYSVLQHSNGFVYVGTQNGLDRFDGYQFKHMPLQVPGEFIYGASGPVVLELREMRDGKILIFLFQENQHLPHPAFLLDPETEELEELPALQVIIIGSKEREIYSSYAYIGDTFVFNFIPNISLIYYDLPKIFRDEAGNEIVITQTAKATKAEVRLKDGQWLDISEIWQTLFEAPLVFGKDFSTKFYIATRNGLISFSGNQSRFESYLNKPYKNWDYGESMRAIAEDAQGHLLVSAEYSNLRRYNPETKTFDSLSFIHPNNKTVLRTNNLRTIISDTDSTIWCLRYFDYILNLNLKTGKAIHVIDSFKFFHHMVKLNTNLLLASGTIDDSRGLQLFFINAKTGKCEQHRILPELLNKGQRLSFILPINNTSIWLGTDEGLIKFDLIERKITDFYRERQPLESFFSPDIQVHEVLNAKAISALHLDKDSLLHIGHQRGGISILDLSTNKLIPNDYLLNTVGQTVAAIVEDDLGIWLSTFNGLILYDKARNIATSYNVQDGLPHHEFNYTSAYKAKNGELFFGGMNGFVRVLKKAVVGKSMRVRVLISEARFANSNQENPTSHFNAFRQDDLITLPSGNRSIAFSLSVNTHSNLADVVYQYWLQPESGFKTAEPDWKRVEVANRLAFEFLPAGKYRLHLRAVLPNGNISEPYSIKLRVRQFFYLSAWFIGLVLFLVVGTISVLIYLRLSNLKKINYLRKKLSSNLHDEVGSMLSTVGYQMELLAYTVDEKHRIQLLQIAASSRRAVSNMRDVIWAIDSRSATIDDLLVKLNEMAGEMALPIGLGCHFRNQVTNGSKRISPELKHNVISIFKEFLSNTIKHADASRIDVRVVSEGNFFEMTMKDDGKGVEENMNESTGQGLQNMRERTEELGGQLLVLQLKKGYGIGISIKI